jgi:hypothetical protein
LNLIKDILEVVHDGVLEVVVDFTRACGDIARTDHNNCHNDQARRKHHKCWNLHDAMGHNVICGVFFPLSSAIPFGVPGAAVPGLPTMATAQVAALPQEKETRVDEQGA